MQMRAKGWGGGEFLKTEPASTYDFRFIFNDIDDKFNDELVATAKAMAGRATDEMTARLVLSLQEFNVPIECIAGLLLRLGYLGFAPGSVAKRPIEFVRNLCVPIRAAMEITDPRIANCVEWVNFIIGSCIDGPFDVLEVLMQESPDIEFLV